MLPDFPYMAMAITGAIHIVLGSLIFINSGISLKRNNEMNIGEGYIQFNNYLDCVVAFSILAVIIGILGILTGVKRKEHKTTHGFKVAYMITSILSALWFSSMEMSLYALGFDVFDAQNFGFLGIICCLAEYLLSIVSASICCCCSYSTLSDNFELFTLVPPGTPFLGKNPAIDHHRGTDVTLQYIVAKSTEERFTDPEH